MLNLYVYQFMNFQTLQILIENVLEKEPKTHTPTSSTKPSL